MKRALMVCLACVACQGKHHGDANGETKGPGAPPSASVDAPKVDDGKGEPIGLDVATDGRVELYGIVFRLAKVAPYVDTKGVYARDVDATFGRFADHPAVEAARKLHQVNSISYNAPVDLAIHVDMKTLKPLVPLEPIPDDLDSRWKGADATGFAAKVARFAAETPFKDFLAKHAAFYRTAEETYRTFAEHKPIVGWYEKTFGPRANASYHLAPSAIPNTLNFGLRAKDASGAESVTLVMQFTTDASGTPGTPGDVAYEVMAHELGHSFVNPIVDSHWAKLEKPATAVLATQKAAMDKLMYGLPIPMARESVNRAVVLLFLADRGTTAHHDKTMNEEVKRGFVWTPKLVAALADVRKKNGGKLPADEVADATQRVFEAWSAEHP